MAMENKQIKVLLGFNLEHREMDKDTEEKLRKYLLANGYEPTFITRRKKSEIIKYLADNRECCHAVLMESADDSIWTENELADLVDDRNINLVLILTSAKEKQLPFLTTLYAAGITSALFEKGGHGVQEEEVAEFLIRPRSRKAAREYYHIDTKNIAIRTLTNEMFDGLCIQLADSDFGTCLMGRFLNVAQQLNPYQMESLISKLPDRIKKELEEYAEYAQLIDQLKESGIRIKYKRPKMYRTINDDIPYVEHAKEAVRNKRLDTEMFEKVEEEKRGLFGRRKKKPSDKAVKNPVKSESLKEEAEAPVPVTEITEIIESMTPFYDYGEEMEEDEAVVEEEISLDRINEPKDYDSDEAEVAVGIPVEDTVEGDSDDTDDEDDDGFVQYW